MNLICGLSCNSTVDLTDITKSDTQALQTVFEDSEIKQHEEHNVIINKYMEYVILGENEPPVFKGIYEQSVPDFLGKEHQELYIRAKMAYNLFLLTPSMIDELPCDTIIDYNKLVMEPISYDKNGMTCTFYPAYGRYEDWDDFRNMGLSIFTEDYLNEITSAFLKVNEQLYYISGDSSGLAGYFPEIMPDTFELISQNELEINFNMVGYYFDTLTPTANDIPTKICYPIKMVNTENGWRFSCFYTAIKGYYK